MSAPAFARMAALLRWQRAAGPYWPFVDATPFLSEEPLPDLPPIPAAAVRLAPAARTVLHRLADARHVAAFLDLPPELMLPAVPRLSRAGLYVVPAIARWCAAPAVVPAARLAALLLRGSRQVAAPKEPRGAVFLLDGRRAGPPRLQGNQRLRSFDNRYGNSMNGLPTPEFLRCQDVSCVLWFAPAPDVAADLRPYFHILAGSGLVPETVCIST